MSVISTVWLSRQEAEEKYVVLKSKIKEEKWARQAKALDTEELEDALEIMNDIVADGQGYRNYGITADPVRLKNRSLEP